MSQLPDLSYIAEGLRGLAVPIDSVHEDPANARKGHAVDRIATSLKIYGQRKPIVVNREQGFKIEAGNGTWRAAKTLGWEYIAAVCVDDDPATAAAFGIADNRLGDLSEWDPDVLADVAGSVGDMFTGFEPAELGDLMGIKDVEGRDASPQIDRAKELNKKWGVKDGDMWSIGSHRLICGDSTDHGIIARLMQDDKAGMVFTDPPYGVSYVGVNNPNGREWVGLANDDLRGDELYSFLEKSLKLAYEFTRDGIALYCWHASSTQIIFEQALNSAGFEVCQQFIWSKGMVLGHSDYHWAHEPVFYCKKAGQSKAWHGDRTAKTFIESNKLDLDLMQREELLRLLQDIYESSTVWKVKRDPASAYLHSTQKPAELAVRAVCNSSAPGDIVLDLFLGSGSTMVACQNAQRVCYGVELSPDYCAVILERMDTAFPELTIERVSDGQ